MTRQTRRLHAFGRRQDDLAIAFRRLGHQGQPQSRLPYGRRQGIKALEDDLESGSLRCGQTDDDLAFTAGSLADIFDRLHQFGRRKEHVSEISGGRDQELDPVDLRTDG